MDKFQAAFEVLYFLAGIDGNVDEKEIDVIYNFLSANETKINFDPKDVVKSIGALTGDGLVEEFKRASAIFKQYSSASDRTTLLDFGLSLISADGKIDENEASLFYVLGKSWDIDMNIYIKNKS